MARQKKKIDYGAMFTLRKDGRYQVSYSDAEGRHYLYDRDPERLWHRLNDPPEPEVITFEGIADAWSRRHWERIGYKTAEAYTAPLRRLKEQFGSVPAEDVTAADISAYLAVQGKQGYSRRSVQMSRDILNMIYNDAIVSGQIRWNPCAAAVMPRNLASAKRGLPEDAAIEAVKRGRDAPFGLFALICLYSGLRRGEALALRYEDIHRDTRTITVDKAVEFVGNDPQLKCPKTKAGTRDAVLLDVLADAIPAGEGYLFPNAQGGLLTKMQYRKRWESYCKAIGYTLTAHQLRHGFATILYEAGVPDKDAQELLGHSTITLTRDVYTHIRQARREETAERLNTFMSAGDVKADVIEPQEIENRG